MYPCDDRRPSPRRGDRGLLNDETTCRLGQGVVARFAAPRASASDNRLMLWRAAMKARQFAIVVSIGASARPIMIEAAIMAPAVSSCLITRYAPRPRIIDCSKSLFRYSSDTPV